MEAFYVFRMRWSRNHVLGPLLCAFVRAAYGRVEKNDPRRGFVLYCDFLTICLGRLSRLVNVNGRVGEEREVGNGLCSTQLERAEPSHALCLASLLARQGRRGWTSVVWLDGTGLARPNGTRLIGCIRL